MTVRPRPMPSRCRAMQCQAHAVPRHPSFADAVHPYAPPEQRLALPQLGRARLCRCVAVRCGSRAALRLSLPMPSEPMRCRSNALRGDAMPLLCAGSPSAASVCRAIRCIAKPPPCFATPCRCLAFPSSALPPPCRADQSRCRALPSKTSAMPTKAVALPSFAAPCRGSALPCPPSPVQPGALPSLCCAHHGRAVAMHAGAFLRRRGYSVPNSFTPSSS